MVFIKIHRSSDKFLTPHFRESEFFCKSVDFKRDYHILDRSLIMAAEIVREFVDAPVLIASTFRTPAGNKACGGAPDSFHLKGMALDLRCLSKQALININLSQRGFLYHSLRSTGINGFGISERFLHIDTRSFGYTPDAEFGSYSIWYY
jgi:uncharacterized protein YcbK (DUF882 family)